MGDWEICSVSGRLLDNPEELAYIHVCDRTLSLHTTLYTTSYTQSGINHHMIITLNHDSTSEMLHLYYCMQYFQDTDTV